MHIECRERRENEGRKKQMENGVLCSGFVVDVTNQDVSCRGFSARRLVIRGQNGRFLPRSLYFFFPWPILFLTREKFRYSCGSSPSRFPPLTKRATDGPSVFSSLRTAPQESTVFLTGPRARNHFASFSLRRRRQPTWK